ncbi:hypothetical protein SAMN02787142_7826 [Burkholderia sp. WP9]|uniref:hypothetical protein n=1 Tax=Burkholderia sp. WP9 TaxID=1500263 RepID=UPI000897A754|nr:hypothetical protein [Burkholderia sp. WP9]SEF12048.1 hypothetical protein SAMN02787142_7826 [Burkholderia sp. WP9]
MGAFEGAVDFACKHSDIQSVLFNWLKGIAATDEDRKKIQIAGTRFVLVPVVQISAAYNIRFWVDVGTVDQGRFIADKNNHAIALSHYQRLSDTDKRRTSEPKAPQEKHYVTYDQSNDHHQGDHVTALQLVYTQAAATLGENNLGWIQKLIKKRPDTRTATSSPQSIEAKLADAGVTVSTFEHPPLNPIFASVAKHIDEKLEKEIKKKHLSGISYWQNLRWETIDEDNCRFAVERQLLLPFVLVEYTRNGKTYSCVVDGAYPGRMTGQKPWRTPSELYASLKRLFSRKKADGATANESSSEPMDDDFQEVRPGGDDAPGKRRVGPWRSLLAPFLSFIGIFVFGLIEVAMSLSSTVVGATVFFGTSAIVVWTPIRFVRAYKHRRQSMAAG